MVSHGLRMNSPQVKIICTSLVLLLITSKLACAAGSFCRGIDCRTDMGRQMCRVCARPPPGKRSDPQSVRELFAARLEDTDEEQFNKYTDPDLSRTCILENVLRRVSPRLRTEIIQILENALQGYSTDEFSKWTNE
ncbi:uncharacterized protein [Amphiura filiformis]|uniref:uncharacterized protein isoform X2 n=1 Tax=Amphiura filiformis TaxID=82378 RepID=UPI003B2106A1